MDHHVDGPSPDRGPAPAYRLAPDTPVEIAADLARLCAGPGQNVPDTGTPMAAEVTAPPASASLSRRLALFGGAAAIQPDYIRSVDDIENSDSVALDGGAR